MFAFAPRASARFAFATAATATAAAFCGPTLVQAHCQVPCGIFDDRARVATLLEDMKTIQKAQKLINELAANSDAQSVNQATRWVITKEEHAAKIITVVSEYFLAQRVKDDVTPGSPGYDAYLAKLAVHHAVMRAAMSTKQTVDPASAAKLEAAIMSLGAYYDFHVHH